MSWENRKKRNFRLKQVVRKSVSAQLACFISPNRPQRSQICVKSQSRLLLDRLERLGGETGEAAKSHF